jgi:hypothetical protein
MHKYHHDWEVVRRATMNKKNCSNRREFNARHEQRKQRRRQRICGKAAAI